MVIPNERFNIIEGDGVDFFKFNYLNGICIQMKKDMFLAASNKGCPSVPIMHFFNIVQKVGGVNPC